MCGIERKFIQSLAAGENVFKHSFKVVKDYNKARKCNILHLVYLCFKLAFVVLAYIYFQSLMPWCFASLHVNSTDIWNENDSNKGQL